MTDVTIRIKEWRRAAKRLSLEEQQLAWVITMWVASESIDTCPEPGLAEFSDWQMLGCPKPQVHWPAVRDELDAVSGHYELPWLSAKTKAATRKPAAWKAYMGQPPLDSRPVLAQAWQEWHELRSTLGRTAWTDRTCKRWLTKELDRYGEDVLAKAFETSAQQQWQGVFPEGTVKETHARVNGSAKYNKGRSELRDWYEKRKGRHGN